jgi:ubiquitin-protein ligase
MNHEAANLLLNSPEKYKKKVQDYVKRYAKGKEF